MRAMNDAALGLLPRPQRTVDWIGDALSFDDPAPDQKRSRSDCRPRPHLIPPLELSRRFGGRGEILPEVVQRENRMRTRHHYPKCDRNTPSHSFSPPNSGHL
jgi:hypothetical protein